MSLRVIQRLRQKYGGTWIYDQTDLVKGWRQKDSDRLVVERADGLDRKYFFADSEERAL